MQVKYLRTSRTLMKVIHVLSDDRHIIPLLQLDKKPVRVVRFHLKKTVATHVVKLENRLRILLKTPHTGTFLKVILAPEAVIGFSKSRKTALHTYPCSSQDHQVLSLIIFPQFGQFVVSVFNYQLVI